MPDDPFETSGFANLWGQHMADSPFTSMGIVGQNQNGTIGETVVRISSEIMAMQHFLLAMAVAVDNLVERVDHLH